MLHSSLMADSPLTREWTLTSASALVTAFALLALDQLSGAPGLREPGLMLVHLGTTTAYTLLLCAPVWLVLRLVARAAGWSTEACAAVPAFALAIYLIAARIVHAPATPDQLVGADFAALRLAVVIGIFSAACGGVGYVFRRRLEPLAAGRYALFATAAGLALVCLLWAWKFGGGATAFLAAAFAVALAVRSRRLGPQPTALVFTGAVVAFVAGAGLAVAAYSRPTRPEAMAGGAAVDRPNVILITFDTLRADMVQGPAEDRPATPSFDRFAQDSIVFENALSAGGWTAPGATSLLTGVCPDIHGFGDQIMGLPSLSKSTRTLPERMRAAGYRTAAIGVNPIIQQMGLHGRFSERRWRPPTPFGRSAGAALPAELFPRFALAAGPEELTADAFGWLDGVGAEPFFLWLHYYDPHQVYTPPREFVDESLFAPSIGWQTPPKLINAVRYGSTIFLDGAERRWLRELYEGEVRWSDRSLGVLLDRLEAQGLYDSSWVILASDHGEEFFEHGSLEHGQSLYQELLRVPFMIKPPGPLSHLRMETAVSTASLTPTLIEALSLPQGEPLSSPSLWPSISQGVEPEAVPLFANGVRFLEDWHAVIFDGHKYIRRDTTGAEELYDLNADPGEQILLYDAELMERGREHLAEHLLQAAELRKYHAPPEAQEMDESSRDLLRSLGYIQ